MVAHLDGGTHVGRALRLHEGEATEAAGGCHGEFLMFGDVVDGLGVLEEGRVDGWFIVELVNEVGIPRE
jgi:hypothetical protein